MQSIRVLVIDDSAFMRKMITEILNTDLRIEVIDTARNGEVGIKKIKELSPDVVTMDVNMPVLDGISALQKIMSSNPVPVIMLSSETSDGTDKTIHAIEHGAVDFIMKPSGEISLNIEMIKNEIIDKVITASKATIKAYPPIKRVQEVQVQDNKVTQPARYMYERTIVAIGTSTGGPRALQRVLKDLPQKFNTPILIVQHMPQGFTRSLAKRLDTLSHLHVKEAEHGEIIQQKTVYIAPGDFHMTVEKVGMALVLKLAKSKAISGHRPSVDVLFDSVSRLERVNKVAVVLTGMGNDGSKGIINLKQKDKHSIAVGEAEETSIVYGMPRAAFETKLLDQVLSLNRVGTLIGKITQKLK